MSNRDGEWNRHTPGIKLPHAISVHDNAVGGLLESNSSMPEVLSGRFSYFSG